MAASNSIRAAVPTKHQTPPPTANPWWWHPGRPESGLPPRDFQAKLEAIDERLAITWNRELERWQIWIKQPRIQTKPCQGWQLLFIHRGPSGEYLPLDERLFARLYAASTDEWGSAKRYFEHVTKMVIDEKERAKAQSTQDSVDKATEVWEYSQIKNIGKGSKFSTYHQ